MEEQDFSGMSGNRPPPQRIETRLMNEIAPQSPACPRKIHSFLKAGFLCFLWLAMTACNGIASGVASVTLAENGKALFPVVIGKNADEETRAAAEELREYLGRITGAEFVLEHGDGTRGLAVGVEGDFPGIPVALDFLTGGPLHEDRYVLRSHKDGIYLIGASPTAAGHAVWDLLNRLGYRLYFPTANWEIIPSDKSPRVAVDTREEPSFFAREIGYDFGYWGDAKARYERWQQRNRMRSAFSPSCGHRYQAIIQDNRAEFDAHPEYFALVDGERQVKRGKFCTANPGLRKLVVEDALRYFEANPGARSISMEPSDGSGWCECPECAKLGSVSDSVVLLANTVADAVNARYGNEKYVGTLAYHQHAMPPSIKVHPRVLVGVTTHQAQGGLTHDQRIEGWQRQGAIVGASDALGTFVWDFYLPAAMRGSDLSYLKEKIPNFYQKGARFMGGTWTSGSWGGVGLGNYFAARVLWNVKDAENLEDIFSEFLDISFGQAPAANGKIFPFALPHVVRGTASNAERGSDRTHVSIAERSASACGQ